MYLWYLSLFLYKSNLDTSSTLRSSVSYPSQLSLRFLRLRQDRLQPRRLHDIPSNLQLPTHKQLLRLRLPFHQLPKVRVAQYQRHVRLLPLRDLPGSYFARFFQVDVPCLLLLGGVFEREGEDGGGGFDGGGAVGGGGGQGGGDEVEGGGGGEGGWGLVLVGAD